MHRIMSQYVTRSETGDKKLDLTMEIAKLSKQKMELMIKTRKVMESTAAVQKKALKSRRDRAELQRQRQLLAVERAALRKGRMGGGVSASVWNNLHSQLTIGNNNILLNMHPQIESDLTGEPMINKEVLESIRKELLLGSNTNDSLVERLMFGYASRSSNTMSDVLNQAMNERQQMKHGEEALLDRMRQEEETLLNLLETQVVT